VCIFNPSAIQQYSGLKYTNDGGVPNVEISHLCKLTSLSFNRAKVSSSSRHLPFEHPTLSRKASYREWGANSYDARRQRCTVDRLTRRIEHLGYRVHLDPVVVPAA
jgi:hypothetical protein